MAASTMQEAAEQDLPGFRFHPTEEELVDFYLSRVALGKRLHLDIIGTLNIYRHDPWDLPGMAKIGEREWYFFVPRDRKAGRPNRTTERGFWKATGSDRAVRSSIEPSRVIGLKKTLVFYQGRAPRGSKTDWVMNEYRLPDTKEDMVLCKVYRKATPLKELEQRASAMQMQRSSVVASVEGGGEYSKLVNAAVVEDDYLSPDNDFHDDNFLIPSSSSSPDVSGSNNDAPMEAKKETPDVSSTPSLPSLQLPFYGSLDQQLPAAVSTDWMWMQDTFFPTAQIRSPWQDQHCLSPYAHLLYY